MGLTDTTTKIYTRENPVFADAFNFLLYSGQKIIHPEQLKELDTTELALPFSSESSSKTFSKDAVQKYRDVLKSAVIMKDEKMAYILLGIENQTDIHYAMPARNMLYDALQYSRQMADIARYHQKEKNVLHKPSQAEYLSKFYKNDKLLPVITLVIHFGADEWDGPLSLHEMLDVPDKYLLKFIQNYQVHLIDSARLTKAELEKFSTSLGDVLGCIKYSNDKKQLREFVNENLHKLIDVNAAKVIQTTTQMPIKISEEDEVVNVCKAIDEMMEDSRNEGRLEGRIEGKIETLSNLVNAKLLSLEDALAQAGMTEEEFLRYAHPKNKMKWQN